MNKDIMIDIETLGTRPDAVITSIAAARFNIESGAIEDSFYQPVDWDDQPGRMIYPDTVQWWLERDDDVRANLLDLGVKLEVVLEYLRKFIQKYGGERDEIIWVNNPEFDITILTHAYQHDTIARVMHNSEIPWEFWNVRDCRTLRGVAKGTINHKDFIREQAHNAMDDVRYQIRYVSAMWRALRGS